MFPLWMVASAVMFLQENKVYKIEPGETFSNSIYVGDILQIKPFDCPILEGIDGKLKFVPEDDHLEYLGCNRDFVFIRARESGESRFVLTIGTEDPKLVFPQYRAHYRASIKDPREDYEFQRFAGVVDIKHIKENLFHITISLDKEIPNDTGYIGNLFIEDQSYDFPLVLNDSYQAGMPIDRIVVSYRQSDKDVQTGSCPIDPEELANNLSHKFLSIHLDHFKHDYSFPTKSATYLLYCLILCTEIGLVIIGLIILSDLHSCRDSLIIFGISLVFTVTGLFYLDKNPYYAFIGCILFYWSVNYEYYRSTRNYPERFYILVKRCLILLVFSIHAYLFQSVLISALTIAYIQKCLSASFLSAPFHQMLDFGHNQRALISAVNGSTILTLVYITLRISGTEQILFKFTETGLFLFGPVTCLICLFFVSCSLYTAGEVKNRSEKYWHAQCLAYATSVIILTISCYYHIEEILLAVGVFWIFFICEKIWELCYEYEVKRYGIVIILLIFWFVYASRDTILGNIYSKPETSPIVRSILDFKRYE